MTTRVLETVLTGRNLLSPVLATAGRDVAAFNTTVAGANAKAAGSAQASAATQKAAATTAAASTTSGAATQSAAAQKIAASNVRASTSAQASSAAQSRAHASAAQSATVASRTQQAANNALASSNGLLGASLTPLTAGLGAVGLGLGYASYRGMEFGTAMSQVQAASQASAGEMDKLRQSAITLGADTQYSAEEAAQGITEMSKAGVSTADILGGGLSGALDLAAAGEMAVADAAELGATAMNVFNLEGDQMSHVADLLAAGAGKAQGSVHDLGMALNQSALVANATGLSIEETAGSLALFASQGLVGSDAGTSFRSMLLRLQNPSKESAGYMADLGLSMYDANGEFVGMEALAGQLSTQLSHLTQEQRDAAMAQMFGSDAVRAANVLYEAGAQGVATWTNNVNDSGYAAKQAAQLTDNLGGDLEKLGGAFDSAMTSIGDGTQGALRFLVQALTTIVDAGGDIIGFWNDLPGPVQIAVGTFAAFVALRGPMDRLFERVAVGITSTVTGMGMAAGATTGLGTAAAGARAAMTRLMAAAAPLAALTILTSAISSVMEFSRAGDDARESIRAFNDGLEQMGNTARGQAVAGEIDTIRDSIRDYQATIEAYESQGWADRNLWYVPFGGERSEVEDARQSLEAYERQLASLERTNTTVTRNTEVLADRFRLSKTEVQELADKYEIDLGRGLAMTQLRFGKLYSEEYGTTPIDAANALEGAVVSAKEQTEEAIKAQEAWLESLQGIAAGFVEPLGAYSELLEEKKAAERESAEATAASTEDASDSWEDYVDDVDVSLTELADRLQQQIENQAAWRQNIGQIAAWAGADVAQHLANMGEEGVDLVAKMADGSSAEAQRMADLIREDIRLGGAGWTAQMDAEMKNVQAIASAGGQKTAAALSHELGIGVDEVARIAAQYGVVLAEAINPLLAAVGKGQILAGGRVIHTDRRNTTGMSYADGGMITGPYIGPRADNVLIRANPREFMQPVAAVEHYGLDFMEAVRQRRIPKEAIAGYADGGLVGLGREFQRRGANVSRHAAFDGRTPTSGHGATSLHYTNNAIDVNTRPGTSALEQRELAPLAALARARGFRTIFMSPGHYNHLHVDNGRGGSIGSAAAAVVIQLPKPPSTAPFGPPISTAADATMQHAYQSAQSFADANALYDNGGVARGAGYLPKGIVAPERVLNERQTAAFERWMDSPAAMPGYGMAAGGGGGTAVVINSPITFAGPVYGGDAMRRIAEDVVTRRDQAVERDLRRWGS